MTDKERLEEIKEDIKMTRKDLVVSPSNELTLHMDIMLDSMDYLTERVQELEDIIYQDARQEVLEGLYEENKRYREALQMLNRVAKADIEDSIGTNSQFVLDITADALKGDVG